MVKTANKVKENLNHPSQGIFMEEKEHDIKKQAGYLTAEVVDWVVMNKERVHPQSLVIALISAGAAVAFKEAPSMHAARETIENCVNLAFEEYLKL